MRKQSNKQINFSKNIVLSVIVPVLIALLALVMYFAFGINKGMDFKGGVIASVVAEGVNLEDGKQYQTFKDAVDVILNENGAHGYIYMTEKDSSTYEDILVVKIDISASGSETNKIVNAIKSDLIAEFYSGVTQDEIELRNLVNVSTFGQSANFGSLVAVALATLVALIAVCVYLGFRSDIHTAMYAILAGGISNILTIALIIITRVKMNLVDFTVVPVVAILSAVLTFTFVKKAKETLKTSERYERKNNFVLANDVISSNICKLTKIFGAVIAGLVLIALVNISNPVFFFAISILEGALATLYTTLFIIPAIFGITYVRRIKKEKSKKVTAEQKLSETEVLKETDLDKLTSN